MGMFDYIRFKGTLPDGIDGSDIELQTKDLRGQMAEYGITLGEPLRFLRHTAEDLHDTAVPQVRSIRFSGTVHNQRRNYVALLDGSVVTAVHVTRGEWVKCVIDAADIEFSPAGRADNPASRLHASIAIAGLLCHLTAVEVVNDPERGQCAADSADEPELTGLYRLAEPDEPFNTFSLNNREYVLFMVPGT